MMNEIWRFFIVVVVFGQLNYFLSFFLQNSKQNIIKPNLVQKYKSNINVLMWTLSMFMHFNVVLDMFHILMVSCGGI